MADSFNELFGLGSQHSEDANLEGFWPLQDDAASTSVDDVSSNNRNGTLEGGDNTSDLSTTGPNGWLAKAIHLNGTDDTVNCGATPANAIESSNEYTLGAWINPDDFGADATVWGRFGGATADNQFLLWVDIGAANGIAALTSYTGGNVVTGTGDANLSSGSWQMVASTWDGTTLQTWLNGVSQDSTTNARTIPSSNEPIWIGSEDGAGRWFDGPIAGAFAFSRDLTAAELLNTSNGPELVYVSGVDFQSDGTFDIGTWALPAPFAAGSNGTQTQEVIAVNAAGSVLDTASTATGTLDLSSEAGNTCYLLARVSNSGGYDIGDHGSRTSGYGSADDGYYELASVTASGGGGPTYTLSADTGSFSASGQDAGLLASRLLTAEPGSVVLVGTNTGLLASRLLTADSVSFFLSGQDAGLLASRLLTADSGSFSLSGQDAGLLASRLLSAEPGSFVVVGQDADLTYSGAGGPTYTLIAGPGVFNVTGQDLGLVASRILPADTGVMSLSGQDAGLLASRLLTADNGSFSLSSQDAGLLASRLLTADSGSFSLSGQDAGLLASHILEAENAAFILTGQNARLAYSGELPISLISQYFKMLTVGTVR